MRTAIALSLVLFLVPPAMAGKASDYFPDESAGKIEVFKGKKLFDYMNGGAELYLAYGFVEIAVWNYSTAGNKATVGIYEMGGPAEAYGIFSHTSKGDPVDVGVPAVLARGMLSFHKGKFYVRVVAKSDPVKAKDLLIALGKQVAGSIPGKSQVPKEVALLPEGAVKGSLRYLVNPETARTIWFDGEGELILTKQAKAVTAFYPGGDSDVQATRIAYPDKKTAMNACKALGKKLSLKTAEAGGECTATGKIPDDVFAALATKDGVLRWVTGASDQKSASAWLARIK
jgi:hypothetical protein